MEINFVGTDSHSRFAGGGRKGFRGGWFRVLVKEPFGENVWNFHVCN